MFAKRMLLPTFLIGSVAGATLLAVVLLRAADLGVPHEAPKPAAGQPKSPDSPVISTAKATSRAADRSALNVDVAAPAEKDFPPIFAGWDTPQVTIIISGDQDGYIEPCGCAGIENQKGGLSRRFTFLRDLEAKGWNPVPLDLGGIISRYGIQNEIKYAAAIDGLKRMGYQAIGFGPRDLRIPAEKLLTSVAPVQVKGKPKQPSTFVSANIGIFEFDDSYMSRFKILQKNGLKIGVTSVLGDQARKQISTPDIAKAAVDDKAALPAAVAAFKKEKCNFTILLAYATQDEAAALAKKFPEFDYIVSADGAAVPPQTTTVIRDSKVQLIQVGQKASHVVALGLFNGNVKDIKYEPVPMDARFADSKEMKAVMANYQRRLEVLGFAKLGIKPVDHPDSDGGKNKFVGSQACKDCHAKAFETWAKSGHGHALDTLVKQDVPRQFDAECLSCHVTGWDPQKFVPYRSGYESLTKTPLMAEMGCENCHGPAYAHVEAESALAGKVADKTLKTLRAQLQIADTSEAGWEKRVAVRTCHQCHDEDNSPKFNFTEYWKKIEH